MFFLSCCVVLTAAPSSIAVVDIGTPLCSLVPSTLIFSRLKSDVQIENRSISEKKKNYQMFYTLKSNAQGFAPTRVVSQSHACTHYLESLHILHVLASDQSATKVLCLVMLTELHNKCRRWPPFIYM